MFTELTKQKQFIAKREGSWERNGGNNDWRPIKAGETLTMADIEGPGKIVHWWCTVG